MEIRGASGGFAPWALTKAFPLPTGGLQHPRTQAETEFLEDIIVLFYFIILFYFIRLSFGKIYCFVL